MPERGVSPAAAVALLLSSVAVGCAHAGPVQGPARMHPPAVVYSSKPFGKYLVDTRRFDDIQAVAAFLRERKIREVVFRSELKMVPGQACENYTPLREAGLEVLEFWVPTAFTPGGLDLMRAAGGPCG